MADLKQALCQGGQQPAGAPGAAAAFQRMDRDGDGRVSAQEFDFAQIDRNGDGTISYEEFAAYQAAQQGGGPLGLIAPGQVGMANGKPPGAQAGAAIGAAIGAAVGGAATSHGLGPMPVVQGGVGGAKSWQQRLESLPMLEIKERPSIVEELTAMFGAEVNMANVYDIRDVSEQSVFQAVETTSGGDRQFQNCCCADCAAWEVHFALKPPGAGRGQRFLRMHRKWQCSCCCFHRPTAYVDDLMATTTGHSLGNFRDPWCTCGHLKFDVDIGGEPFVMDAGCCQCGWMCPLPCGPCRQIKFDVKKAQEEGQPLIATITRKIPNVAVWWSGSSADDYSIEYAVAMDAQKKAMVMALAIFLDFRYFNKQKKQRGPN